MALRCGKMMFCPMCKTEQPHSYPSGYTCQTCGYTHLGTITGIDTTGVFTPRLGIFSKKLPWETQRVAGERKEKDV